MTTKNLMTCSASSPKAFSSRTPPRSSTNAFTFDNHSSTEINPKVEHLVPLPHLPHQENHWLAIGPNKKILPHPAFFNLEGNFEASSVGGFCFSVTRSYFSFMMQDNNADMGLLNQNFWIETEDSISALIHSDGVMILYSDLKKYRLHLLGKHLWI